MPFAHDHALPVRTLWRWVRQASAPFRGRAARAREAPQASGNAGDISAYLSRFHAGLGQRCYHKAQSLLLQLYCNLYIERDIRQLSGAIDAVEFLRFLTAVACCAGQMVNYADIGNDMDSMRSEKVQEWLGLLEKSDIIFYLHPYSNNLLKRTVTKPKLYFYDTGLVAYLTKWTSAETLEASAMNGAILENYTVAEIVKSYLNAGEEPNLFYYRNNDAKEIDIVMEVDGELHPMEIKKTANPGTQLTRPFRLLDKGAVKRGKGAILCMKDQLSALDSQSLIVPIWAI